MNILAFCQNREMSHEFSVSCAIPPEVYKYSEAVIRLGFRGELRSTKELRARS